MHVKIVVSWKLVVRWSAAAAGAPQSRTERVGRVAADHQHARRLLLGAACEGELPSPYQPHTAYAALGEHLERRVYRLRVTRTHQP